MNNEVKLIREMIDKGRNLKSIKIIIPNDKILHRINSPREVQIQILVR